MPLITLTTDYGTRDYFVAAVKGSLYSQIADAQVVDISNDISPYNIEEAAYIVGQAFPHFPKGTVHIIAVNEGSTERQKSIIMSLAGHYFIAPDNGILYLIRPEITREFYVEMDFYKELSLFPALEIYAKAAAHILRGGQAEILGRKVDVILNPRKMEPLITEGRDKISGRCIYIDDFGNIVTNIPGNLIFKGYEDKRIEIKLPRKYRIDKISNSYHEVGEGKIAGIINASKYLEIGINMGSSKSITGASQLLGIYLRDRIDVTLL